MSAISWTIQSSRTCTIETPLKPSDEEDVIIVKHPLVMQPFYQATDQSRAIGSSSPENYWLTLAISFLLLSLGEHLSTCGEGMDPIRMF
jgi:hypothetical protein